VKLHDRTAQFGDVIGRIRRERVASDLDCFRLDGDAPTGDPRPSNGPIAVLGASAWALSPVRAELTSAYLGALGGLLADLGYDVFAIAFVPRLDAAPAFVGWVGGDETPDELAQLDQFDVPGLSVSPGEAQRDAWSHIEPEGRPSSIDFIRAAFDEIRRLTNSAAGSSEAPHDASSSTGISTGRNATADDAGVRGGMTDPRNPSSRVLGGTQRDGLGSASEGS
jgi:hypothetical protein